MKANRAERANKPFWHWNGKAWVYKPNPWVLFGNRLYAADRALCNFRCQR